MKARGQARKSMRLFPFPPEVNRALPALLESSPLGRREFSLRGNLGSVGFR